jgi:outer membrane immunogenic protein
MKKFLLSTAALAALTAGAVAADLPARRMAPAPYAAVPVFTWTGFYVGANIGAGWNRNNRNDDGFGFGNGGFFAPAPGGGLVAIAPIGGSFGNGGGFVNDRDNRTSILGGVQAGYNWQMGGFVVGVEGDIQAIGNRDNDDGVFGFGNNNGNFGAAFPTAATVGTGVTNAVPGSAGGPGANVFFFNNGGGLVNGNGRSSNWFATARVRIGFAVDRALFYVTGGAAFTDRRDGNNFFGGGVNTGAGVPAPFYASAGSAAAGATVAGGNTGFFGNRNGNNVGWALGGGVEYAFTNSLSAKIEYLHLGFDRNRNNGFAGGNGVVGVTNTGAPITGTVFGGGGNRNSNSIDIVRAGLNFRFSGL